MTWENGRELATATSGNTSLAFTYDGDGIRTSKTVNGVEHKYYYSGGQLLRETYGSNILDFAYNTDGSLYSLRHNGTYYYYVTNLQGDVIGLVDASGNTVASYEYDPYGDVISVTGTKADTIGVANPMRYRGYYYDEETGFYYLQSRYYDPEIGRFINDDSYASTGQGVLGNNMFAYCRNNPVCRKDITGTTDVALLEDGTDLLDEKKSFEGGEMGNSGSKGGNGGNLGDERSGVRSPSSPKASNDYNTGHSVGSGKAPKQGTPGSTYTQISSDGKNTVISKTVYGEYSMPAYRFDYGGHSHGIIYGPHIHYYSVYVGPNGIFLNKGPIVQCEIF